MADYREDIKAALANMKGTKLGLKRALKNLPQRLHDGELVQALAAGKYNDRIGLLVLTDTRILFVQESFGSRRIEDFPLAKITTVQEEAGMALGSVEILASGNSARIENITKQDAATFADAARRALHAA